MRSSRPKVLHPVAGRAMIDLIVDACRAAGAERVVVVANPAQPEVAEHLDGQCEVVFQPEPKGTGHALAQAPAEVLEAGTVLVLYADSPLIRASSLKALLEVHRSQGSDVTLASVVDPGRDDGGRIIRGPDGTLVRIVEAKEVSAELRSVREFNVGLYAFRGGPALRHALDRLRPENAAHEIYLTDVLAEMDRIHVVQLSDMEEAMGVNDRVQLAQAEQALRHRLLNQLMLSGVTVIDPNNTYVEVGVTVGEDTVLEPGCHLRGRTIIGRGCRIGPDSDLSDARVGDGCRVERSWLRECQLGDGSDCGPFAKLRAGTRIGRNVHVGSYVEMVRTSVGDGTAVAHVCYLGDATVGADVNIGAGAITANFDRRTRQKHPTVIGDGAFIGVDSMLVAPVTVGRDAQTGAGSVVTKDVPDGALAVGVPARVIRRQVEVP